MEALEYYTQALNLEEHATLYSNRSAVNMQLKRYGAALSDANQCLRLAPEWCVFGRASFEHDVAMRPYFFVMFCLFVHVFLGQSHIVVCLQRCLRWAAQNQR